MNKNYKLKDRRPTTTKKDEFSRINIKLRLHNFFFVANLILNYE